VNNKNNDKDKKTRTTEVQKHQLRLSQKSFSQLFLSFETANRMNVEEKNKTTISDRDIRSVFAHDTSLHCLQLNLF